MSMTPAQEHASYKKGSPTYAGLVANYGRRLPLTVAERFARQHGTTLDELGIVADRRDQKVSALNLVISLGY